MTARTRADAGFTMIELMIVVALTLGVTLAIGGIFVSTMLAERTVRTVSVTASEAQNTARLIGAGVKSATNVRLEPVGSDDQLLVLRVLGRDAGVSYGCQAWYWDSAAGRILQTMGPQGSAIAPPSGPSPTGWAVLLTGVTPALVDGVFEESGRTVVIGFDAATEAGPVRVETAASRPLDGQPELGGGESCW